MPSCDVGIGVYVKGQGIEVQRLKSNKNKRNNPAYAGFIFYVSNYAIIYI